MTMFHNDRQQRQTVAYLEDRVKELEAEVKVRNKEVASLVKRNSELRSGVHRLLFISERALDIAEWDAALNALRRLVK